MVLFNYATKELTAKVVYYGAGLCGKTTNLQWIHEKLPIRNKGKMLSLATETDRTLFFDFLPIEIGTIRGMRTRIQLYTVPGQVFYNATRRMVLKGADCVIFVCDSQEAMLDPNVESFENMRENLKANEIDADEIPVVLQYNKRDLPNALPIEILNERLNPRNYPFFEAVAVKGIGVEDTLKGATKLVFKSLSTRYGEQPGTNPGLKAPSSNPPEPAARAAAPARAPAPPRAGAPAPERPTRSTATIPQFAAESDDLLESLDGPSLDPVVEEVVEDEFEMPAPAARSNPKGTLVTNRAEADDMRRRISSAAAQDYDVDLEEIEEDDDIEELSLDTDPLPGGLDDLVAPSPVVKGPRAASPGRSATAPAARAPQPAPPPTPSPTLPSRAVEVEVEVNAGQADVQVPIELTLEPGASRVTLNLRLILNIKRGGRP
jgi:signal recognition particle receptor subunit beta